jgi:hypothetical protein
MTHAHSTDHAPLFTTPLRKLTNLAPVSLPHESRASKFSQQQIRPAATTEDHLIASAHLRAAWRLAVVAVEDWLPRSSRRTADDIAFEQLFLHHG